MIHLIGRIRDYFKQRAKQRKLDKEYKRKLEELKKRDPFVYKSK